MISRRRLRVANLLVAVTIVCAILTAIAWARTPPVEKVALDRWYPLGLLGEPSVPFLGLVAAVGLVILRRPILYALAIVALATSVSGFVVYQRYTALGVFLCDGDGYWVERAARATDAATRRQCLRIAISGIQYTLDTTDVEVLKSFPDCPLLQRDLFVVLAEIAPNDNWKAIYQRHADEAAARASGPRNQ